MRLEDVRVGMRVRVAQEGPPGLEHELTDSIGTVVDIDPDLAFPVRVRLDVGCACSFGPDEIEPAEVRHEQA